MESRLIVASVYFRRSSLLFAPIRVIRGRFFFTVFCGYQKVCQEKQAFTGLFYRGQGRER